jgi:hypothetical protein
MRAQKVGYCIGKAFFRGSLVGRDSASIDNCVNILFDGFRNLCLVFGGLGGFYPGHYKSPENNIVEQYYTFPFTARLIINFTFHKHALAEIQTKSKVNYAALCRTKSRPPIGITGAGAGADSFGDRKNLEPRVREMLDCPKGVPHNPSAPCLRWWAACQTTIEWGSTEICKWNRRTKLFQSHS